MLTTQSGRIRPTTLLDEHPISKRAQPLITEAHEIQSLTPCSIRLPLVRIRPAQRREEARSRLTDEWGIILRAEERQQLDIEETGTRILALDWLDDLSTVLVIGELDTMKTLGLWRMVLAIRKRALTRKKATAATVPRRTRRPCRGRSAHGRGERATPRLDPMST